MLLVAGVCSWTQRTSCWEFDRPLSGGGRSLLYVSSGKCPPISMTPVGGGTSLIGVNGVPIPKCRPRSICPGTRGYSTSAWRGAAICRTWCIQTLLLSSVSRKRKLRRLQVHPLLHRTHPLRRRIAGRGKSPIPDAPVSGRAVVVLRAEVRGRREEEGRAPEDVGGRGGSSGSDIVYDYWSAISERCGCSHCVDEDRESAKRDCETYNDNSRPPGMTGK